MPWTAKDAGRFSKKVGRGGAKRKRQWSAIANSALKRGQSEGRAIRMANAVAGRTAKRKKPARRRSRS